MHLMIHPGTFVRLFGSRELSESGVFARWLPVYPASTIGQREVLALIKLTKREQQAIDDYHARIRFLAGSMPTMQHGELAPAEITLTDGAERLFIELLKANEQALGEGGEFEQLRDFASKIPEHCGRLAGVLAVYGCTDYSTPVVTEAIMQAAIDLGTWYAREMDRLREVAEITEDEQIAAQVRNWLIRKQIHQFHMGMLLQGGPSRKLRKVEAARPILAILIDRGWIEQREPGALADDGKPHQEVFEVRRR